MMNLIARMPSLVSSSTSVSPVKRYYGSQDPRSSIAKEDRSERPDKGNSQEEARPQNFVIGHDGTELELSVESRLFVKRVNIKCEKDRKESPMLQEMEKNIP